MRRIATVAAILALGPLLSSCALIQKIIGPPDMAEIVVSEPLERAQAEGSAALPGHVEPVHAAVIAQNQAAFWVSSNGCTSKADIQPVVRHSSDGPIITLRRIKEDRCRQVQPEGVEVRWSFEELGLAEGSHPSVENPYQLPPG